MLKNYVKIALKVLLRRKFFTFVSLFGISFTLLVLIVVASFVDYLAIPTRPGTRLDRTLTMARIELGGEDSHVFSYPSYYLLDRYVRNMKTPEAVSIHSNQGTVFSYLQNRKLELKRKFTDEVFWDILEFDFVEGQPYTREQVASATNVAVIDEKVRAELFGDQPAAGKYIETTEGNYRIVGVIRHEDIPVQSAAAQVFVPITTSRFAMSSTSLFSNCFAYLLAADKSDFDLIKAEFAARLTDVAKDHADEWQIVKASLGTQADLLIKEVVGEEREGGRFLALGAIIALMFLFMLFPAINLVNINISRIIERSSEIGVRKAFGASARTLTLQFIIENVFITLIGGVIAFCLALIVLNAISASGLLPFGILRINLRVVFYSLLLCLGFGLLSGVLPAYLMSRLHPVEALRGAGL
ncbi:MAG: ABC transporter permease [bacterium]